MKPRISVITLGVDDLARAVAFYRDGLGWLTRGIVGSAHLRQQRLVLRLFLRRKLFQIVDLLLDGLAFGVQPVGLSLGKLVQVAAGHDRRECPLPVAFTERQARLA